MMKAKVNPVYLLGAIRLAVQNHCLNRSRIIAISNHPDITNARVKYAKMAGGEKDRTAMDIYNGFLQPSRGQTVNVTQQVAALSGRRLKGEDDEGNTIDVAPSFYQGGNLEDRIFGTSQSNTDLDNKIIKIRDRRLEGL